MEPLQRNVHLLNGVGLVGLLLLGVLQVGCRTTPLTSDVVPEGRQVVVLLDASSSMAENDPENVALAGVDLFLGLAGSRDNVGIITYARSADVRVPLGPAGTAAHREAARQALADVERFGLTNFGVALREAHDMLEEAQAPPGSTVVLLTDGVSSHAAPAFRRLRRWGPSTEEAIDQLAAKGWRVCAIALGDGAADTFLHKEVARTGGAVYPVPQASGLLTAFQRVAVEVLGYSVVVEEDEPRIAVAAQSSRVAFIARQQADEDPADPPTLTRDGQPVADARVVSLAPTASHQVFLVENPEPGTWSFGRSQPGVVALVEQRFHLKLTAPASLKSGERGVLQATLQGPAKAVSQARRHLNVRVTFELNGQPWGETLRLTADAPNDPLTGRFKVPTVSKAASLRLRVEGRVVDGGQATTLSQTRSCTVLPAGTQTAGRKTVTTVPKRPQTPAPPQALTIRVTPTRIRRSVWGDEPPQPVNLALIGDSTRSVVVKCGRKTLKLPPRARRTLTVPVSRGALRVVARAQDGTAWTETLHVVVTRYTLNGAAPLHLPATSAGHSTPPIPLQLSVQPTAKLELSTTELEGPSRPGVRLELQKMQLVAHVSPQTSPGTYEGAVSVTVHGADDLSPRKVPVQLTVLPRPTQRIALKGRWGWAKSSFRVPEAAGLTVTANPLEREGGGGTLQPSRDLQVKKTSVRGQYEFLAFVSSDVAPGVYRGSLQLNAPQQRLSSIAVELVVERPAPSRPTDLGSAPQAAFPPATRVAFVLDQSASMSQADPDAAGLRLLALLALGIRESDRCVVVPTEGDASARVSWLQLAQRIAASRPKAERGADIAAALSRAQRAAGDNARVLIYTDDDLDPINGLEAAEGTSQAARAEARTQARNRLQAPTLAPVALRAPLVAEGRQTPYLERLKAYVVELGEPEAAVLERLQLALWSERRIAPADGGARFPIPMRVAAVAAKAPPGFTQVAAGLWFGVLPQNTPLNVPSEVEVWVAPQLPPSPPSVVGYAFRDGSARVVGIGPLGPGSLIARRGAVSVKLSGTPPTADLPADQRTVQVERVWNTLTSGSLPLRLKSAELVLAGPGEVQPGASCQLSGRLPVGLTLSDVKLQVAVAEGPPQPVSLKLLPDRTVSGSVVLNAAGPLKVMAEGAVAVRLEAPVVVQVAAKPVALPGESTTEPEPSGESNDPQEADFPWRPAVGVGALLLALVWFGVLLASKRRQRTFVTEVLADRQLRALTGSGRISPERYLFRQHCESDRTVRIVPEETPGGQLDLTIQTNGKVLCVSGNAKARVVAADRPKVKAKRLMLEHRQVFALVVGNDAVRYVYLDYEPTAEDLKTSFLGEPSDEGMIADSERLVLIDDDQNISHASGRLDASAVAVFPSSQEDEALDSAADSERILLVDSGEESLLDSHSSGELSPVSELTENSGDRSEPAESDLTESDLTESDLTESDLTASELSELTASELITSELTESEDTSTDDIASESR